SFELWPTLEEESGQSCGFHPTGGIYLIRSEEQETASKIARSRARRLGIESEFISLAEAREMAPILNTDPLRSVLYEPLKGHVDPASATQAFAKAARNMGSTVYRYTEVMETNPRAEGGWDVVTNKGTIACDVLVNAAGLWGREVARMAGIELPLLPVEHHYLVTESIPAIEAMEKEYPTVSEPESGWYSRQEGQGLLLGAYESTCVHWAVDGTPLDFDHELLPDALERMEWNFERACEVMPVIAESGVRRVINGPMIFSPDLGPLLGPYPGLPDYFCAAGVMTGFNQGGGIGRSLAEWIIEGEPGLDINCWDVARFGDHVSKSYVHDRTKYFYENRIKRIHPYEEFTAGRPVRTFPIYDRLKAAGAVFGENYGWETPLWYAREGETAEDVYSYKRGNWFDAVGEECRAVRDGAGLFEISTFAKYAVMGEEAEDWLNMILANRAPSKIGSTKLSPMLSPNGKVIGDFTVTKLAEGGFMMLGAGAMQRYHMRHFEELLPYDGTADIENLSPAWTGLMLAGPNARAILQAITDTDVSGNAFPFLSAKIMAVGNVPEAIVARVSFTGELGYEIYCPSEYQRTLFEALTAAGAEHGLRLTGSRALMSLRLEKGFPSWGADLSPDYNVFEAGMERFMRLDKDGFVGQEAALDAADETPSVKRVTLVIDADDADAFGGEAVYIGDDYAGYVSSGGYGHCVQESLALAYLKPDMIEEGLACSVDILGEQRPAIMTMIPRIDPNGSRMRS
ncbi:MAG: FAD-dependent oxidoreductase, partial [Rhodospirillales bacterium]|nr:FAD-dependent oxidoreductase [Rhodospirillales bacterium]